MFSYAVVHILLLMYLQRVSLI